MSQPLPVRFRAPYDTPESRSGRRPEYRLERREGMIVEKDVAVTMRDGVRIYVDIFRPDSALPAAPVIAWSPYGKHLPNDPRRYVNAGIDLADVSPDTAFEAPNPQLFTPRGYAVIVADIRGTWYSEGDATYVSPKESEDFYDLIEWAGTQPWSNGKVGLSGVSYLAVSQWRVAALKPPHLAAINPWEGWTDTYREVYRHGGIPDTWFWPLLQRRWGASVQRIEDLEALDRDHPFYDGYWASKSADLEDVTVPAYVVSSWTDQGLHTRGTLEGFQRISSSQKWLEVHARKKWAYYYTPSSVARQLAFFDRFLLGKEDSEVSGWPRVNIEIRERHSVGSLRPENEWPLARTDYKRLYLCPSSGQLSLNVPHDVEEASYDATPSDDPDRLAFVYQFPERTELTGYMGLHVHMSIEQGDDADVFVGIQKLDVNGEVVPFPYYAQFDDGPVALGWLRLSHREEDATRTTEHRPYLRHVRELKLTPGEPVKAAIEIWASSTQFDAGESLQLVVQGTDINRYPKETAQVYFRHEDSRNVGRQTVYGGGDMGSYLLVPVIHQPV